MRLGLGRAFGSRRRRAMVKVVVLGFDEGFKGGFGLGDGGVDGGKVGPWFG